jgi:hypothetical protein
MKKVLTLLVAGTLTASFVTSAVAGTPVTVVEVHPTVVQEEEKRGSILPFILIGVAVAAGLAMKSNNHGTQNN